MTNYPIKVSIESSKIFSPTLDCFLTFVVGSNLQKKEQKHETLDRDISYELVFFLLELLYFLVCNLTYRCKNSRVGSIAHLVIGHYRQNGIKKILNKLRQVCSKSSGKYCSYFQKIIKKEKNRKFSIIQKQIVTYQFDEN